MRSQLIAIIQSKLLSREPYTTTPHDYASLKEAAIATEYHEELLTLNRLLTEEPFSLETFKTKFKARCAERAVYNKNTCLNFAALPQGECNQLYWQLASIAFEPKNMSEMLAILIPELTSFLEVELFLNKTPQKQPSSRSKHLEIRLVQNPLSTLNIPADNQLLSQLIYADETLFNLAEIEKFNFDLHHKLYEKLQASYQSIAEKLYQHNADFKILDTQFALLSQGGETPRQALNRLIYDLYLGGARITGQAFASPVAESACNHFLMYLESIPSYLKNALLQLDFQDNKRKNFQAVLSDLAEGQCVETAAREIQLILANNANQSTLDTYPHASDLKKEQLKQQYQSSAQPIALSGFEPTTTIPLIWLEKNLNNLVINNAEDYLTILLSFPPEQYALIIQYAQISIYPRLPEELTEILASGVLNAEQLTAFNHAILCNIKKMGDFDNVLKFAAIGNNAEMFQQALSFISADEMLTHIQKHSLLQYAAKCSRSLSAMLALFGNQACQLIALNKTYEWKKTILHLAASTPASLCVILSFYPDFEQLFSALITKDQSGRTVLHLAAEYPESLKRLLNAVPERLHASLLVMKDNSGRSVLSFATKNIESYQLIAKKFTVTKHQSLISEENNFGETMFHEAVKNSQVMRSILVLFPQATRYKKLTSKNKKWETPLELALHYPTTLHEILQLLLPNDLIKIAQDSHLLYEAAKNSAALQMLLNLRQPIQRQAAVENKNQSGLTLLDNAIFYPESLLIVLNLCSREKRLPLLLSSRNLSKNVKLPPESLNVIFKSLSKQPHLSIAYKKLYDYYISVENNAEHLSSFINQLQSCIEPETSCCIPWRLRLFGSAPVVQNKTTPLCLSDAELSENDLDTAIRLFIKVQDLGRNTWCNQLSLTF